jgi:DNA-binding Lrp family transcriptional regulator
MLNRIVTQLKKFDYLHSLLRRGRTGCAEELAKRVGISRRAVFIDLEELRELGIPVEYNKTTDSYEFKGDVKFLFEVTVDGEKIVHIKGGKRKFYTFLE